MPAAVLLPTAPPAAARGGASAKAAPDRDGGAGFGAVLGGVLAGPSLQPNVPGQGNGGEAKDTTDDAGTAVAGQPAPVQGSVTALLAAAGMVPAQAHATPAPGTTAATATVTTAPGTVGVPAPGPVAAAASGSTAAAPVAPAAWDGRQQPAPAAAPGAVAAGAVVAGEVVAGAAPDAGVLPPMSAGPAAARATSLHAPALGLAGSVPEAAATTAPEPAAGAVEPHAETGTVQGNPAPGNGGPPPVAVPAQVPAAPQPAPTALPAAAAGPAPFTHPARLTPQLAGPLFSLASAAPGEHVMTLKVSPEALGPLTVRAHIDATGVRIELFAPADAGRDALRTILPELRRGLAESGLAANLNLSQHGAPPDPNPGGPGGQAPGQHREPAGQPRPGQPAAAPSDAARPSRLRAGVVLSGNRPGVLDILA